MAETVKMNAAAEVVTEVGPRDVEDFARLVAQLSSKKRTKEQIAKNVTRAVASPTTTVLGLRDQEGRTQVTATVNLAPTLRGRDPWIDDVVTDLSIRGHGHSKPVMSKAERLSAQYGDQVSLTSSAVRADARTGYEKRGYYLLPATIHRKTFGGVATDVEDAPGRTPAAVDADIEHLTSYTPADVDALARIVDQSPALVEAHLQAALDSPTTAVFAARGIGGAIRSGATVNLCPIPVGYKPWIKLETAQSPEDAAPLMEAAHAWVAPQYDAVNVTFTPPPEVFGYEARDSGLYVKPLGGHALAAAGV